MRRTKQSAGGDHRIGKRTHDFVQPVDTNKGYWVTGADISRNRHTLRVFIQCRDRQVLHDYLDKLKITFELLPSQDTAVRPEDQAGQQKQPSTPAQPQMSPFSALPPDDQQQAPILDIHLRVKSAPKRKSLDTLKIEIDPPLNPGSPQRYRFPSGNSAHVRIKAEGGRIDAVFTDKNGKHPQAVIPSREDDVRFDANGPFPFRLTLNAPEEASHYMLFGDIKRPDPFQPAEADDELFLG